MAEIIRAEHMGFCSGVTNAVAIARGAVNGARCDGAPVYACGPIIHNATVEGELTDSGLIIVGSVDEIPFGAVYVVRSHGEGPANFEKARAKQISVIDATCPKVRRIQKLAESAAAEGKTVVIVGEADHPEVKGVAAWAGGRARVIGTVCEVKEIFSRTREPYVVLAQTTTDEDVFTEIAKAFESADAEVHNTICSATQNRQKAAKELAGRVDMMVVIGDKTSSNSRKLFDIAKKIRPNTIFAGCVDDLPLNLKTNCNKIGVTAGASTPEQTIEEVIIGMSEITNGTVETNPMYAHMEEIDKALRLPRNGDIITGEVIQVTDKYVIVNLGCKKDGLIPRNEVNLEPDQQLSDVLAEGEEVQAKVLKTDDGDGNILLSKKRAVVSEHWEDINKALEEKETLDVNVVKEVNGGVIAAFHEINGFIPMSQLSDRYVETAEEFIGKPLTVKVMRVDPKRNKVVFTHKAVLNEIRQQRMMEIWDTINVGDIIDGKVMRFTEYGAFVDIGGIDGLLHISEISWGKLRHPEEVLSIDQEIKVKVLSMNKDKEKISLGYKQNLPEPWSVINETYQVGQTITGKAVQIKDYGVFVELEPGLDGLVHISEIAYKRVNNIEDEITVGQEIKAKILDIDQNRRRISLSIKDTQERPDVASDSGDVDEGRTSSSHASTADPGFSPTIGDRVKEALAEAAENAKERAEAASESVKEGAEAIAEKVKEVAEAASEKTEEAAEAFIEKVEEATAEAAEDIKLGIEIETVPSGQPGSYDVPGTTEEEAAAEASEVEADETPAAEEASEEESAAEEEASEEESAAAEEAAAEEAVEEESAPAEEAVEEESAAAEEAVEEEPAPAEEADEEEPAAAVEEESAEPEASSDEAAEAPAAGESAEEETVPAEETKADE
ncbi:MAG: bifunctional 4-hydroxy-3-methylbut-2-enyl diphosphate reductase/30S ribosomal protein S1 [Clostridiales Family XIII bacterium]|nr:bifunctional 4-hydroxy-3-methylbut-2-enyl diphosphate reductase/30S ribosomal protein S1 [Clostridiales Family XIII bacterium]